MQFFFTYWLSWVHHVNSKILFPYPIISTVIKRHYLLHCHYGTSLKCWLLRCHLCIVRIQKSEMWTITKLTEKKKHRKTVDSNGLLIASLQYFCFAFFLLKCVILSQKYTCIAMSNNSNVIPNNYLTHVPWLVELKFGF